MTEFIHNAIGVFLIGSMLSLLFWALGYFIEQAHKYYFTISEQEKIRNIKDFGQNLYYNAYIFNRHPNEKLFIEILGYMLVKDGKYDLEHILRAYELEINNRMMQQSERNHDAH